MYLHLLPPLAKLLFVGLIVLYFSTIALGMWIESIEEKRGIKLSIPFLLVKLVGAVAAIVGFILTLWIIADLNGFILFFGG